MRTTYEITTPQQGETAVALGFFDGVHLGHRAVIERMLDEAEQRGLTPCVFTFSPDGSIPASKSGLTLLQTQQHKEQILARMGVAALVSPDFQTFMGLSPQQYVDGLLHRLLHARVLVCGENYRFGKAAAAGVAELRQLAAVHGIAVVTVPSVLFAGEPVSSTRIRAMLRQGRPELAEAMLGTPFEIQGTVQHGKKLGRTLDSPTANQTIPHDFTIPLHGVYLSRVQTPCGSYWGVTNIGVRPTVNGESVNCETYLIGFAGDLYGETIRVAVKQLLRPEQRFADVQQLAWQIQVDIQRATTLIQQMNTLG